MSVPVHPVPALPLDPMSDGRSVTRLKSRERHLTALRAMSALPLLLLTALIAALILVQAVPAIGEYAFLRSSLNLILPDQPARLLTAIAVGLLIAYSLLWFVVGHRLALAKEAQNEGTEKSAGWRAFGPVGVMFVLVALGSLVFMAWRRADVLAARAASVAIAKAKGANVLGSVLPQEELDRIGEQAHGSAWAGDFIFVTGVMVLLGAVAVAVGLAMHLVVRAWLVVAIEARADRWNRKVGAADTARHAAQDALSTRISMREERGELAHHHHLALSQRFDHAREHARVYLAQKLGDPSMTTHVLPSPADAAQIESLRP